MNPEIEAYFLSFRRPPGPVNIWKVLDLLWTGIPIRITIQEIPEESYDDVVKFMCQDFLKEEPIFKRFSKYLNIY